jgi:hypothetical protein
MTKPLTKDEIREQVEDVLEKTYWLDGSAASENESFKKVAREFAKALEDAGLLARPGDQDADETRHIIRYAGDGWTVMHPLSCRPNLFNCKVWKTVRLLTPPPPNYFGKYYCGLDDDGKFTHYEKVEDDAYERE